MKRIGIILVITILSLSLKAQNTSNRDYYISPEITIGYTFHGSINIGFSLEVGLISKKNENIRYGYSMNYYLIKVKDNFHRQRAFYLTHQSSFSDIKIGLGRTKHKWGYNNRNRCLVHGIATDISFNYPSVYSPKIGYRNFLYNHAGWAWFEYDYHTLYGGYEYKIGL